MNILSPMLAQWEAAFEKLKNGDSCAFFDMSEGQRIPFVCRALRELKRPVVYVTQTEKQAMQAADDAGVWIHDRAAMLPARETSFVRLTGGREKDMQRLGILSRAARGEIDFIAVAADALCQPMAPYALFSGSAVKLKVGSETEPAKLIDQLLRLGYTRADMVEGRGQCALRGEIVDVFPPDTAAAVRIEFFDTEVDSIRLFDCVSQRSDERLKDITIFPAWEFLIPAGEGPRVAESMRALIQAQQQRLPKDLLTIERFTLPDDEAEEEPQESSSPFTESAIPRVLRTGLAGCLDDAEEAGHGLPFAQLPLWSGIVYPEAHVLPEWLPNCILIIDTPEKVMGRAADRFSGFEEELKMSLERGQAVPEMAGAAFSAEELPGLLKPYAPFTLQDFLHGASGILDTEKAPCQLMSTAAPRYENRMKDLAADITKWQSEGRKIALFAGGDSRAKRLQEALRGLGHAVPYLSEEHLDDEKVPDISIFPLTQHGGFVSEHFVLIADSDIFGTGHHKSRERRNAGERIEAFTDLKENDYVVHESHGVGIFRGTVRLQSEGTWRDYLYIQYQGNDKLYVPTDQFDRVQKFIGNTDTPPKINSLSGGDWEKTKNKVRAGLKKLAFDLVQLYAARQNTPGYAFGPDSTWQGQFEDQFPWELTPDQARAVRDIKRDMESSHNMDRLLCGDVGYGKTEVALRAAFKAVMDGKQAAILAPTTILAQQHYYTLLKRLKEFPVRIDVLSRFRTAQQQRQTLQELTEGKIDILVGTHRLLGKDVHFKDLGLLIVDEEQRFGVSHKESIKNMKNTVDVLTLSATPIPRTLHMSMVGVRDMSLLETPPEERFPVQTFVMDYNEAIIRDAIMRELGRGGQIYFLYNRVTSIDLFRARLKALVPEARIVVAHGQMKAQQLEDVMLDFYEGKFDVLLCTTIIENGVDVPNANTMIIYDADHFGLSQLYQLRGRVGRSTRAAYAYFTVRADKMLSETAQKRLDAIREFTAFGSGFRIAMRDLQIRGAGNIFGPQQSGNVSQVGYDMYCRLIEEAVQEARLGIGDKAVRKKPETKIELKMDAFLPTDYVSGAQQRMEIYKRISAIGCRADREDVIEELIDRFSDPPESVMNLIEIASVRAEARRLGIGRITHLNGALVMRFEPGAVPDPIALYDAVQKTDKRLIFSAGNDTSLLLRDFKLNPAQLLRQVYPMLENLCSLMGCTENKEQQS